MTIDAYSLCPGGTGKKIKFCCAGSRVEDFRKIGKYIEGEQYTACLNFIDGLLAKSGPCACLLALRCEVLGEIPERDAELLQAQEDFYARFPENPIAKVEYAESILARQPRQLTRRDGFDPIASWRTALLRVSQLFEEAVTTPGCSLSTLFRKFPMFLQGLMIGFCNEAAASWCALILASEVADGNAREMASGILKRIRNTANQVPCLREGLQCQKAPEGVPWQAAFDAVLSDLIRQMRWSRAIERYGELAEEHVTLRRAPALWYNLAMLHEWQCDLSTAQEMWEKYAACPETGFYQAVNALMRAAELRRFPFQDEMELYSMTYTLTETDSVLQKLIDSPYFARVPEEEWSRDGVAPRPMAGFRMLDAPWPASSEEVESLTGENVPVAVCSVALYGRRTDAPPQLRIYEVLAAGAGYVQELLGELLEGCLVGEVESRVERSISVTDDLLTRRIEMFSEVPDEVWNAAVERHTRFSLLNRWRFFPLGMLGGVSITAAAKKPEMRLRVEAALGVLRTDLLQQDADPAVLDALRETLGLPPLPALTSEEIDRLPISFFYLLKKEQLSQRQLEQKLVCARVLRAALPGELLTQTALDEDLEIITRVTAIRLILESDPDLPDVSQWVQLGRDLCVKGGLSDVTFDLVDAVCAFQSGKIQTLLDTIRHIETEHADDPSAQEQVRHLKYVMYGIAQQMMANGGLDDVQNFEPDQVPPSNVPFETRMMSGSGNAHEHAPGGEGAERPTLWMPDSVPDPGAAGNSGAAGTSGAAETSKLWLPD